MVNTFNRCKLHPKAVVYSRIDSGEPICEICNPEEVQRILDSHHNYYFIGEPPCNITQPPKVGIRTLFIDDAINTFVVKFFIGADTKLRIINIESPVTSHPRRIGEFDSATQQYIWGVLNAHCREIK